VTGKPTYLFAPALLWGAAVHAAAADTPPGSNSQCPLEPLATPERYERPHQIPTKPAPDDPAHKMVTPGGMVLELPKMVAATDTLTMSGRDASTFCFELVTFSRNRSRCEIRGVARDDGQGILVFREGDAMLRLEPLSRDEIKIEPVGDGYRRYCESGGRIDAAVYTLLDQDDGG